MIEHQFLTLYRKLLEKRLLSAPILAIVVYLLNLLLLVTHLQVYLFQQPLEQIVLVLQHHLFTL